MLRSLHIENIALISSIDIDFDNGFSVLTGETGAGKSIIIDSINLLLGCRMSKELIRKGEKRASVDVVHCKVEMRPQSNQTFNINFQLKNKDKEVYISAQSKKLHKKIRKSK